MLRQLEPLEAIIDLHEAESADDAWSIIDSCDARGQHIAVIISDHVMPGTNGVDFLRSVVDDGRFPHSRKLLLTGQATYEDTVRAINEAGIDAYVGKPWNEDELLATTRRLLLNLFLTLVSTIRPCCNTLIQRCSRPSASALVERQAPLTTTKLDKP